MLCGCVERVGVGEGPGRPPRSPLGIFKALVVKRLRRIPSDRELYRRLWDDRARLIPYYRET